MTAPAINIGTVFGSTVPSMVIPVPVGGVPAGSLIVVGTYDFGAGGSSHVSDTQGNLYTKLAPNTNPIGGTSTLWYAYNCKALSASDSISITKGDSTNGATASAIYATVLASSDPHDASVDVLAHGGGVASAVNSGTPSVAGDLIVSFFSAAGYNPSYVNTGAWTGPFNYSGTNFNIWTDGGVQINAGSALVSYAPTVNSQAAWNINIAGFKGASLPLPPPGIGNYSAYPNDSTTPRQRVLAVTQIVYFDPVNGSDGNIASASPGSVNFPFKTLQAAVNFAQDNFEVVANPSTWFRSGNFTYAPGIIVEMIPNSGNVAAQLPQPLSLRGLGPAGMIWLRGGSIPSLTTAPNYHIYAANSFQGLAPQDGAVLIVDGFTITGAPNCTLLNSLFGGRVAYRNCRFGSTNAGLASVAGAADGAYVSQIGPINLFGPGFASVFEAVALSVMTFSGDPITFENPMNFGAMIVLSHSDLSNDGGAPVWANAAGNYGQQYRCFRCSFLGIDHNTIPGSAGDNDGTSVVI